MLKLKLPLAISTERVDTRLKLGTWVKLMLSLMVGLTAPLSVPATDRLPALSTSLALGRPTTLIELGENGTEFPVKVMPSGARSPPLKSSVMAVGPPPMIVIGPSWSQGTLAIGAAVGRLVLKNLDGARIVLDVDRGCARIAGEGDGSAEHRAKLEAFGDGSCQSLSVAAAAGLGIESCADAWTNLMRWTPSYVFSRFDVQIALKCRCGRILILGVSCQDKLW